MKQTVHLQLYKPFLSVSQADEIRAQIAAMRPTVHLVMPAPWPDLEVRGVDENNVQRVIELVKQTGVRFRVLVGKNKTRKAQVMVSETTEVC